MGWNCCVLERRWRGDRWRVRCSATWPASASRALIALCPLPTATSFQLDAEPVSLSPDGFTTWSPAAWTDKGRPQQKAVTHRWSDISSVAAEERTIMVDGEPTLELPLAQRAAAVAEALRTVHSASPDRRQELIHDLSDRGPALADVPSLIDDAARETAALRLAGTALWSTLFVVAPIVLSRIGGPRVLIATALVIAAMVLINIGLFVRTHARVLPAERWQRLEFALIMLLNWPMASRAADLIDRHRFSGLDPLLPILGAGNDEGLAGRILRDLDHPLDRTELDPTTAAIVESQLTRRRHDLDRLIDRAGLVTTGPDHDQGSYCPRCLTTFTHTTGSCVDCPGVELVEVSNNETGGDDRD